jgi:hypothetical protein
MFEDFDGAKELTIEDIENFLNSDDAATPAVEEKEEGSQVAQPTDDTKVEDTDDTKVNETQAFAHRLKKATDKAIAKERESIAKSLGYESYAQMQKSREEDILKDKGLDPEEVSPVVEQLVAKRLAEDPRMQELEGYRQQKVNEWAKKELAELNELTNGKVTKLEDVPKNVLELWKTKGSLKAAYLELEGEKLIREMRTGIAGEHSKGSTGHLRSPQGTPAPVNDKKRPFTQQEKDVYKLFNPGVTDEELNKMYKEN